MLITDTLPVVHTKKYITMIKSIISVVVYNMSKPSIGRKVWIKLIIAQLIHYPQPHLGDLILLYIHFLNLMKFSAHLPVTTGGWGGGGGGGGVGVGVGGVLLSPSSVGLFVSWFVCTITHDIFSYPRRKLALLWHGTCRPSVHPSVHLLTYGSLPE